MKETKDAGAAGGKGFVWLLLGVAAAVVLLIVLAGDDVRERQAGAEEPFVVEVDVARYDYAPGSTEPIVVPQGRLVELRITSLDVTHGFAITGHGVQEEVPAGQTVTVRFHADEAGEFTIYCTVFCGGGHADHKGSLHVV